MPNLRRLLPVVLSSVLSFACDQTQEAASKPADAKPADAKPADAKPADAEPQADAEPHADAKPPKASGIALTFSVNGKATTIELSAPIIDARPAGSGLATWSCEPALGAAKVVDFGIGDDAARKGELFVGMVQRAGVSRLVPGKTMDAHFQYRFAGEPTPKKGTGTMVWNEGLLSGTAEGKGENGDTLSATWACTAAD